LFAFNSCNANCSVKAPLNSSKNSLLFKIIIGFTFAKQLNKIRDEKLAIEGHIVGNFKGLFLRPVAKTQTRDEVSGIIPDLEGALESENPLKDLKERFKDDTAKTDLLSKLVGEKFNPLNIKLQRYDDEASVIERALNFLYSLVSHVGLIPSSARYSRDSLTSGKVSNPSVTRNNDSDAKQKREEATQTT
jgi:hypothetical protein